MQDLRGYNIQNGYKFKHEPSLFSPQDALDDHIKTLDHIKRSYDTAVAESKNVVVVGHHTPSTMSCGERFTEGKYKIMNGGFHSDLSEFILDRPKIKVWIHGHTHDSYDYKIGDTRILCNPRGYHGYEMAAKNFMLMYYEIVA
jgi:hypothetical protein